MYALVGPPTLVCMLMALFGPTYFVLRGAAALKKVPVVKDIPGIKWPSSAAELLLELPGKLWRAGEWMVAKAIAFRNWFQTKFWPWLVAAYHKWWPRLKAGGRFVGRGLLGAGRTLQAARRQSRVGHPRQIRRMATSAPHATSHESRRRGFVVVTSGA